MTKTESDAIFMAELLAIDTRRAAGLSPGGVLAQQLAAIMEQFTRVTAVHNSTKSVDNL
jgi:hypothetical protein